jgi:threonyl-tRNA synthetase
MSEVTSFLKMMDEVYTIFGLDYTMALSTRPEGYLGEPTAAANAAAAASFGTGQGTIDISFMKFTAVCNSNHGC